MRLRGDTQIIYRYRPLEKINMKQLRKLVFLYLSSPFHYIHNFSIIHSNHLSHSISCNHGEMTKWA